jgi:predicted DNA-binding transcriptional regulator AlpA
MRDQHLIKSLGFSEPSAWLCVGEGQMPPPEASQLAWDAGEVLWLPEWP